MKKRSFFLGMLAMALIFGMALAGCDNGTDGTYQVGSLGPSGGRIFFDKGEFSDGWRYLEAAPENCAPAAWGSYSAEVSGTGTGIGMGKENTRLIVAMYPDGSYAANLCKIYRGGNKDDWFLPSMDELNLMYTNLKQHGLGDFSDDSYWSSSCVSNNIFSMVQDFSNGAQVPSSEIETESVRAVRAF
ncbi:MAG: DUF1566 domain-containing protein [Spirochaetaceae bacterium]|jgi:hypothetical protein|nr:DUF1566 domain-containing protein [Spirochaetaceae bacterium]